MTDGRVPSSATMRALPPAMATDRACATASAKLGVGDPGGAVADR